MVRAWHRVHSFMGYYLTYFGTSNHGIGCEIFKQLTKFSFLACGSCTDACGLDGTTKHFQSD
jgi:hypothetical protein